MRLSYLCITNRFFMILTINGQYASHSTTEPQVLAQSQPQMIIQENANLLMNNKSLKYNK